MQKTLETNEILGKNTAFFIPYVTNYSYLLTTKIYVAALFLSCYLIKRYYNNNHIVLFQTCSPFFVRNFLTSPSHSPDCNFLQLFFLLIHVKIIEF